MKNIILSITLICLTYTAYTQHINSNGLLLDSLDKKIPVYMKQKNVPGMAIVVIDDGTPIIQKEYGYANIGIHKKVDRTTSFNIGSISKLFTAVAIMKLVEEGKINLNDPVENYLTRWKLPDTKYDKNKVTIRGLLNHTAGISVHGYPGFTVKRKLPNLERSLQGVNGPVRPNERVEVILEPNTKFKYSGGGYTILQLVIEEVTKMPFHKFMKKKVFKPLQMKNTSFKITNHILKPSAIPYDKNGKRLPFEYFAAQGAAGLQTTTSDFILFVDEIINKFTLISKETIDQMIMPTEVSGGHYGLGFRILRMGKMEFVGHSGSNTGWQSAFFIDFKNKSGLIMMTNGDDGKRVLQNTLKTWALWKYKR